MEKEGAPDHDFDANSKMIKNYDNDVNDDNDDNDDNNDNNDNDDNNDSDEHLCYNSKGGKRVWFCANAAGDD